MYKPERFGNGELTDLARFVNEELAKIGDSFLNLEIDSSDYRIWYELPPRPSEGAVCYIDSSADATITTTGLHEYRGGAWQKL